ncbi:MAG: tRNA glutamyl-Q(34) synthetase GluQRS [Rhodocyclaceae bacterium]
MTASPFRRMPMYVGRFAPSPTGPLHFGSLVAALGSCLEARVQSGRWLLRIEDVDAPRTVAGATDTILRQLEACGFEWDGGIVYQSERLARYRQVLDELIAQGKAFGCACTRREMVDSSLARDGSRRYPGTCREGLAAGRTARAWRMRTAPGQIVFDDAIQGRCHEDVWADVGDFVLLRADAQYAYQLAVVVDDAEQGVTHIVRGADLLDSTARQIYLQRQLGVLTPHYAHLPVVVNAAGEKLSKQTLAPAVAAQDAVMALHGALRFLGQQPPANLARSTLGDLWAWARAHWDMARVPHVRAARAPRPAD